MSDGRYEMVLAKEDFKFSGAHFTIFSETRAEFLHGHNYRVKVRVVGGGIDALGLLLDLETLKVEIRRCCAELDGKMLVPTCCDLLSIEERGDIVDLGFDGRRYSLPAADVTRLPLRNISIEELALHLWREIAETLQGSGARQLEIEVEETAGQSCRYRAEVPEVAA
jgi:6-pyruvoyltetrahydropterin/6-carboxytetrahydropterin synthase